MVTKDYSSDCKTRTLSFHDTVRARQSCRSFSPTPVDPAQIREVLEDARWTPSNCNTQPWQVHIVSGAKRAALSQALLGAASTGKLSLDFSFDDKLFDGRYGERRREHGALYYSSLGVARDDIEGRRIASDRNFTFFGAPHVAFLFMPSFGDNVRVAGDIGMFGQTFLLALAARGLGGVPQTVLGYFADTVRECLGVPDTMKLLFGISFGHPSEDTHLTQVRTKRDQLDEFTTFHE